MKTPLQQWINDNPIAEKMIWKSAALEQFNTLQGLPSVFSIFVVGTHRSKSIELPVIFLEAPSLGLKVWARNNFYGWAVTIESTAEPIEETDEMEFGAVRSVYFEGFEEAGIAVYEKRTTHKLSFHTQALARLVFALAAKAGAQ